MEQTPKPMILDFYTDWCGWCKKMMKTTYANQSIAQYINTNFYPVKFNAEGKDTVTYLGKVYKSTSGEPKAPHELAVQLLQGKLMYPTTFFSNNYNKEKKEFGLNMIASGYLDEKKIEPILIYTVENVNRNASLDEFTKRFEQSFYDSTLQQRTREVKWETLETLFSSNLPLQKKSLVFINTEWCNSCKVMKQTSFSDTLLSKYLGEKFNLVNFNAERTDTIIFKGHKFFNQKSALQPFHQLAVALCRDKFSLPTLVVLDEKLDLIDAIPYYLPPAALNDILHYFGDDVYKAKTWQAFMEKK